MAKKSKIIKPNGLFKVSQSKVNTYQRCRYAYHLKYFEKLRAKRKSRPLQFGSIVHSMLEAHADGDDPFDKLKEINFDNEKMFRQEREMYGNIVKDIRLIMKAYFRFWEDDGLIFLKKNGKKSEHEFEIEAVDGILVKGKIDAYVKSSNGMRWLTEHKTFGSQVPKSEHRWRNLQTGIYKRMIDMMGWKPVEGTLWDYIKSKPPTVPKVLAKTGKLSSKKIDTLPSVVKKVIRENNFDPQDYSKLLNMARENLNSRFVRIYNPLSDTVVDNIYKDFIDTAREMSENHGKVKVKSFGRHCEWCDFAPICRAELTGGDVDYIKERDYEIEEEAEIENEEPERRDEVG